MPSSVLLVILICAAAAALEAICAGSNVKRFFASIRHPRYSAPLWVWSVIGAAYYVIFGFALYRFLVQPVDSNLRVAGISLIIAMMMVNALTNYVIFRARNLRLAFLIGAGFAVLDLVLFAIAVKLDGQAAAVLIPYLLYRPYAVYWGYALWRENSAVVDSVG